MVEDRWAFGPREKVGGMWRHRLIASLVFVSVFAVPVAISLATESPGGVPHTTEWHGKYEGCKWTHGWARRTWNLMDKSLPGPQKDPNYDYPGRNGKMYDFRCEEPPRQVRTVTATSTITQPGSVVTIPGATVTVPGPTQTVTVPGPTGTSTVTVTATATVTATETQTPEVGICHQTGNGSYNLLFISDPGELNGHLPHEGDIIPAPEGGCPESD